MVAAGRLGTMAAVIRERRGSWRASKDETLNKPSEVEEEVVEEDLSHELVAPIQVGFNRCFLLCFVIALGPCMLTTLLFSEIGYGKELYEFVTRFDGAAMGIAALLCAFCGVLYILDFYNPPHISKFCTFFEHDTAMPTLVFCIKAALVFTYGVLDIRSNPMVPILLTVGLGPTAILMVHTLFVRDDTLEVTDLTSTGQSGSLQQQVKTSIMRSYVGDTRQSRVFWAGGMVGCIIAGLLTGGAWMAWVLSRGSKMSDVVHTSKDNDEYIRWIAPGIAGAACFGMGIVMGIRVHISNAYEETVKNIASITILANEFRAKNGVTTFSADLTEFQYLLQSEMEKPGRRNSQAMVYCHLQEKWSAWQTQKKHFTNNLSQTFKMAGGAVVLMGGGINAYTALVSSSSQFASVFLTMLTMFILNVCGVVVLTCHRLSSVAHDWLQEMPLWRMAMGVADTTVAKAMLVCMILPIAPMLAVLSMVNQCVRRRRRIYPRMNPSTLPKSLQQLRTQRPMLVPPKDAEMIVDPVAGDQWLTDRIRRAMRQVEHWDWVAILRMAYLLGFGFTCYTLSPRLLNVGLAALISILSPMPFGAIIGATVAAGIFCFLLPPVPGIPVYLFTGIVIAGTCPSGFFVGCGIAIAVSYIMKLTACAIQQVGIGGGLGRSLWIKSQVGVHKPFIRAIEVVLRKPGLGVVKISIACGGPDWPTSVLAGLLGISLLNMELATLPVVMFLGPCTLSGAFYLKKAESEVWDKYASLMLNFTVVCGLVQQLVAAWAIQDVLENQTAEVSKPLKKNLDLDWMDYKSAELSKCFVVRWGHLNCCLKFIFIFGLVIEVGVAQLFYWQSTACFGDFAVTDPIDSLKFVGEDGLLKMPALIGLGACALGFLCYFIVGAYIGRLRKPHVAKRWEQLQAYEPAWRAARLRLARQAEIEWPPPPPVVDRTSFVME